MCVWGGGDRPAGIRRRTEDKEREDLLKADNRKADKI